MKKIKKWIPLLIFIALALIIYFSGLTKYFSFKELHAHREAVVSWVEQNALLAPLLFIALYVVVTALSLPIAIFLSLTAGFLFSQPFSSLYVLMGATIGATIIFLVARTALKDFFKQKAGKRLKTMEREFRNSAANYMLFLRLVPLFPFWLVNVAPAFFGVPLRTFIWTTALGIIPGTVIFTQAGAGLGAILDSRQGLSVDTILNTQVKIALILLGLFALIPVLLRKIRKTKTHD